MNTVIDILSNVDFDNSYNNVLDFVSRETQEAYFDTKIAISYENYATVRANKEITVGGSINDLRNYSYCRYSNTIDGVEKTFYAFIVKKEYVNPTATKLYLEVDVWQTYMFDYTLKQSFINRQHKDRFTKTVENKLKPIFDKTKENLDYGSKYVLEKQEQMGGDTIELGGVTYPVLWYYITASELIGNGLYDIDKTQPSFQDNMSTNYYSFVIPIIKNDDTLTLISASQYGGGHTFIDLQELKELSEQVSIVSIQISNKAPFDYSYSVNEYYDDEDPTQVILYDVLFTFNLTRNIIRTLETTTGTSTAGGGAFKCFLQLQWVNTLETTIYEEPFVDKDLLTINSTATKEYEPKLLIDPYRFAKIKSGDVEKIIQLEDFTDYNITFSKIKSVATKGTTMIIPKNYKNMETNFIEALINIDENNVAIRTDAWKQYEATNKANLRSGLLVNAGGSAFNSILSAGIGLATGNPFAIAGAVTSGVSIGTGIANEMLKREDIKKSPDTLQSTGDDIMLKHNLTGLQDFILFYEIEEAFKEKLFRYFQFYGYASNEFGVPNTQTRYYFNYIKTFGVNLTANLDNDIIAKLKSIYDNGVTIWHYRSAETFKGIYNYAYENLEMTIYGGA